MNPALASGEDETQHGAPRGVGPVVRMGWLWRKWAPIMRVSDSQHLQEKQSTCMTYNIGLTKKHPAKHPSQQFKFGFNPLTKVGKNLKWNWKTRDKCWGFIRIPHFPIQPCNSSALVNLGAPRLSNKAGARPLQLPAAWSAKGTSFRLARLPKGNCVWWESLDGSFFNRSCMGGCK